MDKNKNLITSRGDDASGAPVKRYSARYSQASLPTAATVAGVVAVLYFGREVFLPLAVALLLTFALAPLVWWLRRVGFPRVLAVGASVFLAFALLGFFTFVLVSQVADMARNTAVYQANILSKIQTLKAGNTSEGLVERISAAVERVGREIEKETEPRQPALTDDPRDADPVRVEVVPRQRPIEVLQNVVGPLIGPFSTAGLVIVVVIFMLLEREDLRDRFIRLVGYGDLHRTTEALQDAGRRVGQYLLMQLVVNVLYAIPVGIGLWLIGLPNALLWGLLTLVLRFVPYIGPAIGMLLPMFLALAVSPGWTLLAWTAALFIVMELISNNIIEPWLYGSQTGLSPLAIIVAAIFWTWLWGPLGLVLSTPLTVCLVVLGKHVPQFEFFEVLFGSNQVLDPRSRLYQRLLADDPEEATDQAEEVLETEWLVDFYSKIAIPALILAERDRARGVLVGDQMRRFAQSAQTLITNLEDTVAEEANEAAEAAVDVDTADKSIEQVPEARPRDRAGLALPDGEGRQLLCVGGRSELDDVAVAMLAQVLNVQGAQAKAASFTTLTAQRARELNLQPLHTAVVGYLNSDSIIHARLAVRRLKRARPSLRVGVVFWNEYATPPDGSAEVEKLAQRLNADFVTYSLDDTVTQTLAETPAMPLRPTRKTHAVAS